MEYGSHHFILKTLKMVSAAAMAGVKHYYNKGDDLNRKQAQLMRS